MGIGGSLKQGFQMIFNQMSGTIQVHKAWGTPNQITVEMQGLKNNEKGRPSKVMFQFPERLDISVGDVIQQKGGADLWRVTETEDHIHGDIYTYFEAKVVKLNAAPPSRSLAPTNIVIHGANYGGIQVSSPNAIQSVSAEFRVVSENIDKLRVLAKALELGELDNEDLENAFSRLVQLSQKEKSPSLLERVKEKLEYLDSVFKASATIATTATLYIGAIAHAFGIPGF